MRITKSLRKFFALALCMIMACSLSVGAFAAEVSATEYSQNGTSNEVVTINLDEVLSETDIENLNSRGNIILDASKAKLYNVGSLRAGQTVNINVVWGPSNYELHIGLVKSSSSTGNLAVVRGGSASINATVPTAGTYYLMIANPSTTQALTVSHLSYAK